MGWTTQRGGPIRSDTMRLVVIAKECLPGRVKTRLTPALTPAEAAALARVSLEQTLATVRSVEDCEPVLLLQGRVGDLDTGGFLVVPQAAGGLDERIAAIFDLSTAPVLLIGMDTPQIPRDLLQAVVDDDRSDAWFGPATDGGFWGLGLRTPRGELVRGVPMSRSDTGAVQLDRLRAAGLRPRVLPSLTDVDLIDDAAAVAAQVPGTAFAAEVVSLLRRSAGAVAGAGRW